MGGLLSVNQDQMLPDDVLLSLSLFIHLLATPLSEWLSPHPRPPPPPPRRLFTRSAASSAGEGSAAPPRPPHALSEGLHLLLAALLGIYTEAYAYSPATLQPVFTTLTEHLVSELTTG